MPGELGHHTQAQALGRKVPRQGLPHGGKPQGSSVTTPPPRSGMRDEC